MLKTLILTKNAQEDLDGAYEWYQKQNQGLGNEFIRCIDAKLSQLIRNPLHHQVIYSNHVRRVLTNRFPFSVYFVNE